MTATLVLRRSRSKTVLSVLGSIAFVTIGLFMVSGPMSESSRYSPEFVNLMGWLCIVFFGGTGLLSVRNLFRPTEVVISAEGFQVKGVRRTPLVPWRDVRRFFIAQVQMSKFVCYELDQEPTALQLATGRGGAGAWGNGQIPAHLEQHPDKVLELLEEWRRRHAV